MAVRSRSRRTTRRARWTTRTPACSARARRVAPCGAHRFDGAATRMAVTDAACALSRSKPGRVGVARLALDAVAPASIARGARRRLRAVARRGGHHLRARPRDATALSRATRQMAPRAVDRPESSAARGTRSATSARSRSTAGPAPVQSDRLSATTPRRKWPLLHSIHGGARAAPRMAGLPLERAGLRGPRFWCIAAGELHGSIDSAKWLETIIGGYQNQELAA